MFDLAGYKRARTVDEAIGLLSKNPEARLIAGGTDVLIRLRERHPAYRDLVDIHRLPELRGIRREADGSIVIGSAVTFAELIRDKTTAEHVPVLALAASTVGGPQIRNTATLGGNICNGAPSADGAAPLLVLNAIIELKGPEGFRRIPIHGFYLGPGRVDLRPAEVMTCFRVAAEDFTGWRAYYFKYAMREAMDIATIGCAAATRVEGDRLADLRLAYIVAGPVPLRCWSTEEKIKGTKVDRNLLGLISSYVLDDLKPRDSWRASKAFREQIIKTLAERVVAQTLDLKGATG